MLFDVDPYVPAPTPPVAKLKVPVLVIVPPVNPVPVATDVTPALELVPAPIKLLTSAADIPEFKLGTVPLDKIAGTPVSPVTVQFNVTVPLVPPPLIPVPAVTPVMSPWGMLGKTVKLPSPST